MVLYCTAVACAVEESKPVVRAAENWGFDDHDDWGDSPTDTMDPVLFKSPQCSTLDSSTVSVCGTAPLVSAGASTNLLSDENSEVLVNRVIFNDNDDTDDDADGEALLVVDPCSDTVLDGRENLYSVQSVAGSASDTNTSIRMFGKRCTLSACTVLFRCALCVYYFIYCHVNFFAAATIPAFPVTDFGNVFFRAFELDWMMEPMAASKNFLHEKDLYERYLVWR